MAAPDGGDLVFEAPDFGDATGGGAEAEPGAPSGGAGTAAEANRARGALVRATVEHVVRSIVEDQDAVTLEVREGRRGLEVAVHVAPADMGRLIGRRGRVVQALRTLARVAAAREGTDVTVEVED
jgi:predicted RNA-binding protein YlqC (UPF0109 family)